jgi:hypothetical protein
MVSEMHLVEKEFLAPDMSSPMRKQLSPLKREQHLKAWRIGSNLIGVATFESRFEVVGHRPQYSVISKQAASSQNRRLAKKRGTLELGSSTSVGQPRIAELEDELQAQHEDSGSSIE